MAEALRPRLRAGSASELMTHRARARKLVAQSRPRFGSAARANWRGRAARLLERVRLRSVGRTGSRSAFYRVQYLGRARRLTYSGSATLLAGARYLGRGRDDVRRQGALGAACGCIQFRRRLHCTLRQSWRDESGAQAFGGGRSGKRFEGEQIGYRGIGMRQIYFRSVHNFFGRRVAARYADGLRAMVSLLTAGASGLAGLGSAAVLSLRQLVAGVIDDVPLRTGGGGGISRLTKRSGSSMSATSSRHSRSQQMSMPR